MHKDCMLERKDKSRSGPTRASDQLQVSPLAPPPWPTADRMGPDPVLFHMWGLIYSYSQPYQAGITKEVPYCTVSSETSSSKRCKAQICVSEPTMLTPMLANL